MCHCELSAAEKRTDIYGEDESGYAVPLHEEADEVTEEDVNEDGQDYESHQNEGSFPRTDADDETSEPSSKTSGGSARATVGSGSAVASSSTAQSDRSLPAKPASPSSSTLSASTNSLSYSAQIAQQFSTYQQTPSQERQQRSLASKMAPTLSSGDSVFGKKPSEMHDAG